MSDIKRIIITHHTHTDIGYTGIYPDVAIQHVRHLRAALDLCRADPRFRWTIEAGWPLDMFLSVASAAEKQELADAVRRGQIEVTGFYGQPLTQLCNLEELCAHVELMRDLVRDLEAPIDTVMVNDIGGLSANTPQVLRHYDIKHVVNGCGGWRVMMPFTTLPHLFRLTGPDGSRVLFYQIKDDEEDRQEGLGPAQYGFGGLYFVAPMLRELDIMEARSGDDLQRAVSELSGRDGIDSLLARLERQGYPYDTMLMQFGSDNNGPNPRLMEALTLWNERYGSPIIELGTCHDFFEAIEAQYADDIPVLEGELTCSWTEHAVTYGRATGIYRRAKLGLQRWASLAACCAPPSVEDADRYGEAVRQLAFFSDHTFGLSMWSWGEKVENYGGLFHDAFDLARESWAIKRGYTAAAEGLVRDGLQRQKIALARDDSDSPGAVSVCNPSTFTCDAQIIFHTAQPAIELVGENGEVTPVQSRPVNTKWHRHEAPVQGVGAFGMRVYTVRRTEAAPPAAFTADGWTLSGPADTVQVDPNTGSVRCFETGARPTNRVDEGAAGLNEVCFFEVDGVPQRPFRNGLEDPVSFRQVPLSEVSRLGATSGVHAASLNVERRLRAHGDQTVVVQTQYTLDRSGLRIRNRVSKRHLHAKEALFFAFPFALEEPFHFDLEQQGQTTRFPDERLPGSTNHNLGTQHFVSASDGSSQAVLTILQACVVALGQPSYYHYGMEYQDITAPTVYSYALNNLWDTNCPICQDGELDFEYHVALFDHPYSAVAAYRASRAALEPPPVFPGDLREAGLRCDATNLLEASAENIVVEGVRPRPDGVWQIRLVEVARQATTCDITLAPGRFSEFALPCGQDGPPGWQTVENDAARLEFRAAEFMTLLLK